MLSTMTTLATNIPLLMLHCLHSRIGQRGHLSDSRGCGFFHCCLGLGKLKNKLSDKQKRKPEKTGSYDVQQEGRTTGMDTMRGKRRFSNNRRDVLGELNI
eukprot:GHVT01003561.1.p1 GENE.GHVT01003561.1~~GHVT01003561.1.p1  ORF type:complete len:100 (-),score=1.48 GHVT01003561.1:125-424(-)